MNYLGYVVLLILNNNVICANEIALDTLTKKKSLLNDSDNLIKVRSSANLKATAYSRATAAIERPVATEKTLNYDLIENLDDINIKKKTTKSIFIDAYIKATDFILYDEYNNKKNIMELSLSVVTASLCCFFLLTLVVTLICCMFQIVSIPFCLCFPCCCN